MDRKAVPPFLYYFSITSLMNLFFLAVVGGLSLLLFQTIKIKPIILEAILIYLFIKILLISWALSKSSSVDQAFNSRFIGLYFGRYFGLLIGGMLGYKIASGVGMLVGALAFYFVGRWIGPRVSYLVISIFERYVSTPERPNLEGLSAGRPTNSLFILYVILPWLFVLVVLLCIYFDIRFGFLTKLLPFARIFAILTSMIVIVFPWLAYNGRLPKNLAIIFLSGFDNPIMGLILSIIPALYGFVLYILGASILEFACYALASSLTAGFWWIRLKPMSVQ